MDVEEMKRLCEKATDGPWIADDNEGFSAFSIWEKMTPTGNGKPGRKVCTIFSDSAQDEPDAAFIAASRTFIPEAIQTIEAQRKALEVAVNALNKINKRWQGPAGNIAGVALSEINRLKGE